MGKLCKEKEREQTGRERIEVKRLKAGKLCKEKEREQTGREIIEVKRLKAGKLCKDKERALNRKGGEYK